MSGKFALLFGNTQYSDPALAQLSAPGQDAQDLGRVLQDPNLCAFDDVRIYLNELSSTAREIIDEFLDGKKTEDLLLLYFSGHGIRDELGSLYLAFRNTVRTRLHSTAVEADFIQKVMNASRSKRQVLILDCCNSGAFPEGTKAELGGAMGLANALQGYGRYVLTASDATQLAWEGDRLLGETRNSLFTHFLIKGLEGEADRTGEGSISVDALYEYAHDEVIKVAPNQTPLKNGSKQEGDVILRQIPLKDVKPIALPEGVAQDMEDERPFVRERAVLQLERLLGGKNLGTARSARAALEKLSTEDDSLRVRKAAGDVLAPILAAEQQAELRRQEELAAQQEAEEERIVREKAEAERKAREEAERLAAQQAEEQRLAAVKAQEEQAAQQKAAEERIAREKAEARRKRRAELAAQKKAEEERPAVTKQPKTAARKKATADQTAAEEAERAAQEWVAASLGEPAQATAGPAAIPAPRSAKRPLKKWVLIVGGVAAACVIATIALFSAAINSGNKLLATEAAETSAAAARAAMQAATSTAVAQQSHNTAIAAATNIVLAQVKNTAAAGTQAAWQSASAATSTSRAAATAQAQARQQNFNALKILAKTDYIAFSGRLTHNASDNYIAVFRPGLNLKNFIVQATFINPYPTSKGRWDYGFLFRDAGGAYQYRIILTSKKEWALYNWTGSAETPSIIDSGTLYNFDVSANGSNQVSLVCNGNQGALYVNDTYVAVASLDLSARTNAGDVEPATGLYTGDEITGYYTGYKDFTVWSLP